ncbi:uncharacterized protein LOC113591241 [Electrophorus electricus]|uniref:uncharacterized protein LOC113591241 n=1 Tax=Electrophorus electricus TaxID=8005 RepID=UPI0015CFB677|nr:uncharacterized protein LOC113591241 [Electrophorus electricus]
MAGNPTMMEASITSVCVVGMLCAIGTSLLLLAVCCAVAHAALGPMGLSLALRKLWDSVGVIWASCGLLILSVLGSVAAAAAVRMVGAEGVAAGGVAAAAGAVVVVKVWTAARRAREWVEAVVAASALGVGGSALCYVLLELGLTEVEAGMVAGASALLGEATGTAYEVTLGLTVVALLVWLTGRNRPRRKREQRRRERGKENLSNAHNSQHTVKTLWWML